MADGYFYVRMSNPTASLYVKEMNENLRKIIDQKQLISMMNKTKWNELCSEFEKEVTISPLVNYKLITSECENGLSEVWWHEIYEECQAIEWLNFSKAKHENRGNLLPTKEIDVSEDILAVLEGVGVPYSDEGDMFRVWGYVSSTNRPEYV